MNNKEGKQNRKVKNKSFTNSKLKNKNSIKKKTSYRKAIVLLAATSPRPMDSGLRIELLR